MGWARLDDSFHDHPKLIGLSLEALGLWTKCFTWAHRHHGSSSVIGFLPRGLPETFAGSRGRKLGNELVTHGLWDESDNGWAIHDYADYLPASEKPTTANDVRKARSEAGKRGADARWGKGDDKQDDGKLLSDPDGKPMPPTRPDPNPTRATSNEVAKETSAKRGSRLSPDWVPSEASRAKAMEDAPSVDHRAEHSVFVDYWIAQPGQKGVKTDWEATWRNWMRRKEGDVAARRPAGGERMTKTEKNLSVVARYAAMEQAEQKGIGQ